MSRSKRKISLRKCQVYYCPSCDQLEVRGPRGKLLAKFPAPTGFSVRPEGANSAPGISSPSGGSDGVS